MRAMSVILGLALTFPAIGAAQEEEMDHLSHEGELQETVTLNLPLEGVAGNWEEAFTAFSQNQNQALHAVKEKDAKGNITMMYMNIALEAQEKSSYRYNGNITYTLSSVEAGYQLLEYLPEKGFHPSLDVSIGDIQCGC